MQYIKEKKQIGSNKFKLKIRDHYITDKNLLNTIYNDFYPIYSIEIVKKEPGFKTFIIECDLKNFKGYCSYIKACIKLHLWDHICNNDIDSIKEHF